MLVSDELIFSSMQLIVEGVFPTEEFLRQFYDSEEYELTYQDKTNLIETKIIKSRYYCFYTNYGEAMPHNNIVVSLKTHQKESNPRTIDQVEPNKQFFSCYDIDSKILYVSNARQKGFLQHVYKTKTGSYVDIKNIYSDVESFIQKLNMVDTMKFVSYKDIFNEGNDLFSSVSNIFGFGMPNKFTVDAEYNVSMKESIAEQLRRLNLLQKNGEIRSLVCVGRDDDDVETVFNTGSFIRKIDVTSEKDDGGLYDEAEVFSGLIDKIQKYENI